MHAEVEAALAVQSSERLLFLLNECRLKQLQGVYVFNRLGERVWIPRVSMLCELALREDGDGD